MDRTNSVDVKSSVTIDISVLVTGSGVTTTVSVVTDVTVDSTIWVAVMVDGGKVSVTISVIRLVSVWYSVKVMGATDTETYSVVVSCSVNVSVNVVLITDGSSEKIGVVVLLLFDADCRLFRCPILLIKLKNDEKMFCASIRLTIKTLANTNMKKNFIFLSVFQCNSAIEMVADGEHVIN